MSARTIVTETVPTRTARNRMGLRHSSHSQPSFPKLPALDRLRALHPSDLVLSAPVAAEIEFGLRRLQEGSRRRLLLAHEYDQLRRTLPWADWTEPAALAFGRWRETLERAGTPVGDMDVIIASVATALGGGVAIGNARDFRRMVGLHVDDWPRA